MDGGQDPRTVEDPTALRMRVATFKAGIWLTYTVCPACFIYALATWERPHRTLLSVVLGMAVLAAVVFSRLPAERIVRSRYREPFFLSWSLLDIVLITVVARADGGTNSPLALLFFLPVVFAAVSYPLQSVMIVGAMSVGSYLVLALSGGGASWDYQFLFMVMLACAGVMSAWQARNQERQRLALTEVSRTDPLTGCLNRRGFEERAMAEISAACRRAGRGAIMVLDVDRLKQVNDERGHAAGDELLRWVVRTLTQTVRPTDAIGRLGGDEFAVLFADIDSRDASASARRIVAELSGRAPCSVGLASFPVDGIEFEELSRRADARLYASRHGRPESARASTDERLSWAGALARAVDVRMNAEHEHSRSVADLAVSIAAALGWDDDMLGMLRIAAMLHDVGKVAIPDQVLCNPGRLSAQDFELIKSHSVIGAQLVGGVEGLQMIVPWIRHSHEHFDGSGYPDGLSGNAIPQASRIMLVADAFDAITSARPYREALPVEHACRELRTHAGSQFDPDCVQALLGCVESPLEPTLERVAPVGAPSSAPVGPPGRA